MNQQLTVTKRDGRKETIDLDKIHRVITWAAEGLQNVSVSQVELRAHIQFYDGITTSDIHETIIKSAADLISEESPDYQYLAARLAVFHPQNPTRIFRHQHSDSQKQLPAESSLPEVPVVSGLCYWFASELLAKQDRI